MTLRYSCRNCNATSYRRIIARDERGEMRPSGMYACSGCSVVFADPEKWRKEGVASVVTKSDVAAENRARTPNFSTGWTNARST